MEQIPVKLVLTPGALVPTYGTKFSAGADLYASESTVIPARGKGLVKTGIKIEIPTGYYGRIAPRSGLALKNSIDVGAGVIDADFVGFLAVVLFNHSPEDFSILAGDRIAQIIFTRIAQGSFEVVTKLSESVRNEGGFGSTGK